MTVSPIALFVSNRLEATEAVLESLSESDLADQSELTVFCDGPRSPEESDRVEHVRAIVREATGFKAVHIVERPEHVGHSRSVISGVTQVLEDRDALIVVEDDLILSPHFLPFMNEALTVYADEERVVSISGYSYPYRGQGPQTFFLPGTHCWGWATWRRGWAIFEQDATKLLEEIVQRDLIYAFDAGGAEPLTQLLQRSVFEKGDIDSWVLRWIASAIANEKLTLYPGRSLVHNARLGSSLPTELSERAWADRPPRVGHVPVESDVAALRQIRSAFIRQRSRRSHKVRLFSLLAPLLPFGLEKSLYSALIRRSLRRYGGSS